ncbi:hypothetical protein AC630_14520 [Bradyrhizobium sp. AS23.2]|nr:hypothetical protein AC630_14520 [Bradyrhizobium sp. AS23.2]
MYRSVRSSRSGRGRRRTARAIGVQSTDPHSEEPRLRGVSKGEATSRAFILRDARAASFETRVPRSSG